MRYPSQFIQVLEESLDKRLLDFYELNKEKYGFPLMDANELIKECLSEFLNDETRKVEVNAVYRAQLKYRRERRVRLVKKIQSAGKEDRLFLPLKKQLDLLSANQIIRLYGTSNVSEIIDSIKENAERWKDDSGYLCEFPFLMNMSSKKIYSNFKSDVFINIAETITRDFKGSIDSFFNKQPETLVGAPFFGISLNAFKTELFSKDNNYTLEIFNSGGLVMDISVTDKHGDRIKLLDGKDQLIISTLLNNLDDGFYSNNTVTIELGELAKCLHSHPSKFHYDDAAERLYNMTRINYTLKNSRNKLGIAFNLFDHVKIIEEENDKKLASVVFGTIIAEDVIKSRTINVPSSSYDSLELEMSRRLYHSLQQERITMEMEGGTDYTRVYMYSFFKQRVYLPRTKTKNMDLITAALDDFKKKNVLIKSFEVANFSFKIDFYPLSPEEKADLLHFKTDDSSQLHMDG